MHHIIIIIDLFTNKLAVSSLISSLIIHKSSVGASLLALGCISLPILQRLSEPAFYGQRTKMDWPHTELTHASSHKDITEL